MQNVKMGFNKLSALIAIELQEECQDFNAGRLPGVSAWICEGANKLKFAPGHGRYLKVSSSRIG